MRGGILQFTPEALATALRLPAGTTMREMRWDGFRNTYEVLVLDHPDLPGVAEGDAWRPVMLYRRTSETETEPAVKTAWNRADVDGA